jgi:diguanylate cyclase (GGDEF)-like protein
MALSAKENLGPVTLVGMAGIGKTQLAREYAQNYGGNYNIVWWMDGNQELLPQLRELGQKLNSFKGCPMPNLKERSHRKWIEEISVTDSLTGIYNRRYFDQIFPKFINTAKRNNDKVCFYMIDVDCFKLYNDHYGHQAGDAVLVKVAQTIRNALKRSDDYCFRIGGEEFALLIRITDVNLICDFGESLRLMVEELKIPHAYNTASPFVTISIGQYCEKGLNIGSEDTIYKLADDLLYGAKESGRNQVKCSSETDS